MLISKTVIVKWNSKNKGWYESKGYIFTKMKDSFEVSINHLPPTTKQKIEVLCDYCLEKGIKTIVSKTYQDYLNGKTIIEKDCCEACRLIKTKEVFQIKYGANTPFGDEKIKKQIEQTNLERYGVLSVLQSPVVQEKIKQTNIERYGAENPNKNKNVRNKIIQTNIERYGTEYYSQTEEYLEKIKITSLENWGTEHPSQNPEIRKRTTETNLKRYGSIAPSGNLEIQNKIRESLYKNGTSPCSTQQLYICNLVDGKLNYPIGNISLDIAFPEEMIYIEYDGSGHDLSVKFGYETYEKFNKRNRKRWYYLFRNGWKEIRIISKQDLLPSDEKILEIIVYAKQYLNNNYHYIKFDIDNSIVKTSQFEKEYDFGHLKRIKIETKEVSTNC